MVFYVDRKEKLTSDEREMETQLKGKIVDSKKQNIETEKKITLLKDERQNLANESLEAERQIMLWERKIILEKETQAAIDETHGKAEVDSMKKEVHRMTLRYDQLKKAQEEQICEMERLISKRQSIETKVDFRKSSLNPKKADLTRKISGLKQTIFKCGGKKKEIQKMINEVSKEHQKIDENIQQCQKNISLIELEAGGEEVAAIVKKANKSKNLSSVLKWQTMSKRYDDLISGKKPPPVSNNIEEELRVCTAVKMCLALGMQEAPQLSSAFDSIGAWVEELISDAIAAN
eukprot:GHVL01005235.1.p1 GENE.GHVL01005235.1~~GHVL01005235.1.p1  ORF type:complete len:290 (+),score=73.42 GHVL01005235.1:82-951(+)